MIYRIPAIVMMACLSLNVCAEVYQWTDAQGRVHFGDRPPPTEKAREMRIREPRKINSDAEDSAARMKELDNFFRRRQEEREASEQQEAQRKAEQEKRKAACRDMLAEIKHMEKVRAFYELNDDGERVFLDDEEGDRIRREYRQQYADHCGKP